MVCLFLMKRNHSIYTNTQLVFLTIYLGHHYKSVNMNLALSTFSNWFLHTKITYQFYVERLTLYILFLKCIFMLFSSLFLSLTLTPTQTHYQVPRINIWFDFLNFREFLIYFLILSGRLKWNLEYQLHYSLTVWFCKNHNLSNHKFHQYKREIIILITPISKACHEDYVS